MEKLKFTFDLRDCPTAEELIRFRERRLPKKRAADISYHLTFCDHCHAALLTTRETAAPERVVIPKELNAKLEEVAKEAWPMVVGKAGALSIDVNQVLDKSLKTVDKELHAGEIAVRKNLARGLPALHGDSSKFEKWILLVLRNVVMNEMRQGSSLTVRSRRIDSRLQVKIIGTGLDLPSEEARRRVFEPMQGPSTGRGTGLGLAMVERMVKEFNGTIQTRRHGRNISILLEFPVQETVADVR